MTNDTTVVGWDGSPAADAALAWAVEHEARRGGAIRVLHVLDRAAGEDPEVRVAAARRALTDVIARTGASAPDVAARAELVVGDPVAALDRAAGHERLLVLGASRVDRIRHADARRIPLALAAWGIGATAVVPAGDERGDGGVVLVVSGRERCHAAVRFAVEAAMLREEPPTLFRLHDPHDLDVEAGPTHVEDLVRRLEIAEPTLDLRLATGWVSSPCGLLTRSDAASLLVLEGHRPTAAPPRYSLERWLAGRARSPFVVVAEAMPPLGRATEERHALALAV